MLKAVYILLFIVITSNITIGQEWPKIYGDSFHSLVRDIKENYDKGYFIVGYTYDYNGIPEYSWLIKTDINGSMLWNKKFGDGNYLNGFTGSELTNDNGLIICGATSKYENQAEYDALFIKFNFCGEIEWCRVFRSPGNNYGTGILQLADGSYIGMLQYYGGDIENIRISLVKMDNTGEPIWIEHLAQEDSLIYNEEGRFLTLTSDSNYLVSGRCYYPGMVPFWILTDQDGSQIWDLKWGNNTGKAHQVIEQDSGLFYSTAMCSGNNRPLTPTIFTFDSNGQALSKYYLLGDTIERGSASGIYKLNDSNIAVGICWSDIAIPVDHGYSEIIITDTIGNTLRRRLLLEEYKVPKQIIQTYDSKILVADNYVVDNNWDIYLWKLNSDLQDDTLYTQPFTYDSLCPYPITSDTVDLNCSLFVDIEEIPTKEEYENNIRFYPNPGSEIVTFSYAEQNSNKEALIYVYNSFGILVKKIRIPDRQNQHTINISSFTSGLYIAVLRNERKIIAKGKFIIAR